MAIFSKEFRIALLISFIAAIFLTSAYYLYLKPVSRATLILAFENNGRGRMFTGEVIDGMTVLDAIITSSDAGRINFRYDMDASGQVRISRLNGYNENSVEELSFYLNNEKINSLNINKVEIRSGDIIVIKDD